MNLFERCDKCNKQLSSFLTGKNSTKKGELCDDCYYEEFGDELDEFPIQKVTNTNGCTT